MGNPGKEERLLTCSSQDWGRASLPVEGWEESTYFLWPESTRQTATTQSAKEQIRLSLGHTHGAHGPRYHGQASNIRHKALVNAHTPPPHGSGRRDEPRRGTVSSTITRLFCSGPPEPCRCFGTLLTTSVTGHKVSWNGEPCSLCHEHPAKGRDEKRTLLFSSRKSRFFSRRMR